jgi:hypothetical protein
MKGTTMKNLGLVAALAFIGRVFIGGYRTRSWATGKTYPHSSTRQRARYARQIAAGQIKSA